MPKKINLDICIYHILSEEKGPSQRELYDGLVDYAKRIKEHNIVLNVDKGNLSRRLASLEDNNIIIIKRKKVNGYHADSYYLQQDIETFKKIVRKIAENIDTALRVLDSRNLSKIMAGEGFDDLTFEQICNALEIFIKSNYTSKIIKNFGFESTYCAFNEIVKCNCGLLQFIEIARKMIYEGSVTDLRSFGKEFLQDCEEWKENLGIVYGFNRRVGNNRSPKGNSIEKDNGSKGNDRPN